MSLTAPTLAFPHPTLTKIIGQPTYTSITLLTREIYANASTIPSLRGGGAHGHLGTVMDAAAYLQLTTVAFALPAHPGTNPNHPTGTTSAQIQESICAFNSLLTEHALATTIHKELKKQLLIAVDRLYLITLKDATFGFANVMVAKMLTHLNTTYGTLTCSDLEKNWASISMLWTPNEPIELLWEHLREVQCIATAGTDPISDAITINLIHLLFKATGMFSHVCDTWLTHTAATQTMTEFQVVFNAANKECLRRLTTSQASFHSANAITMAAARSVPPPAPLTTVPAHSPVTANDGTQVFYCWTHGLGFNKNHTSATCSNLAKGHCQTATIRNMRGGNSNIMSSHHCPKPDATTDATTTTAVTAKAI